MAEFYGEGGEGAPTDGDEKAGETTDRTATEWEEEETDRPTASETLRDEEE